MSRAPQRRRARPAILIGGLAALGAGVLPANERGPKTASLTVEAPSR